MRKEVILLISTILFLKVNAQEKKANNFEDWSTKPEIVSTSQKSGIPSDANVLFSDNLNKWKHTDGKQIEWPASKKGFKIVSKTKSIKTKESFGNCQLHVEWKIPNNEDHGESLDWGNSGLYFMGFYEVQIYDSYNDSHEIYYNGQAGSIYKQHSPLVNVCKKPGEWESYDIIFTAPKFNTNGSVKTPAYFTVFQNGVLIQNHVEVRGGTSHSEFTAYKKHAERLPLLIQSHGSAVEYRNIWIREL